MQKVKQYPAEIPATEEERDALMGTKVVIGNIIDELTVQVRSFLWMGKDYTSAVALAMKALEKYGSDSVRLVELTEEMINRGDYGFRLKGTGQDE